MKAGKLPLLQELGAREEYRESLGYLWRSSEMQYIPPGDFDGSSACCILPFRICSTLKQNSASFNISVINSELRNRQEYIREGIVPLTYM